MDNGTSMIVSHGKNFKTIKEDYIRVKVVVEKEKNLENIVKKSRKYKKSRKKRFPHKRKSRNKKKINILICFHKI